MPSKPLSVNNRKCMHTQLFKYIHVCTQNDKYRIKDDTHSKIKNTERERERWREKEATKP